MIEVKELPPPADLQRVRRALLSVFDKRGIVQLAQRLATLDIELVSTGGTARLLREAGLDVNDISSLTGFPEILGGRVKTLHPAVHGGLLFRRNSSEDVEEIGSHEIAPIDLVVANLYPFETATGSPDVTDSVASENIDIGGPTMIRAAAKNFFFVGVCTNPDEYDGLAETLEKHEGCLSLTYRRDLARRAFERTADYDRAINAYFLGPDDPSGRTRASVAPVPEDLDKIDHALPRELSVRLARAMELRYGENPHQRAALYGETAGVFRKLHGKALSFNNLLDLNAALGLIGEFAGAAPTVAILKHTNPCGVATRETQTDAWNEAFATDRQSPFGGIVVVNRPLTLETARAIDEIFTELIIAPAFEEGVLELLTTKKNRRIVKASAGALSSAAWDIRTALGGILVQERDPALAGGSGEDAGYRVVTKREPTGSEWADMDFAWRVAKHVKSNAIVYARQGATLGVGAGQMSRIDASEIAVMKSRKSGLDLAGSVVASDAFFPFPDGLIAAADQGARSAIQPGGSIRDEEVIAAADERDMTMVFTGRRHFRH